MPAEAIKRIVKMIKPLEKAAELLEEHGSLEAAIEEKRVLLAAISREMEQVKEKIDKHGQKLKALELEAAGRVDAASVEATRLREKAELEAEALLATARAEAGTVRKKLDDDCKRREAAAEKALLKITEQIEEQNTVSRELEERITEKAKKVGELEAKLDEIRAQARSLI